MNKGKRVVALLIGLFAVLLVLLLNIERNKVEEIASEDYTDIEDKFASENIKNSEVDLIINYHLDRITVIKDSLKNLSEEEFGVFDQSKVFFRKSESDSSILTGSYVIPGVVKLHCEIVDPYIYNNDGKYFIESKIKVGSPEEQIAIIDFGNDFGYKYYDIELQGTPESEIYEKAIIKSLEKASSEIRYATVDSLKEKDKYRDNKDGIIQVSSEGPTKLWKIESPIDSGLFHSDKLNEAFYKQLKKGIKQIEVENLYSTIHYTLKDGENPPKIDVKVVGKTLQLEVPEQIYDEFISGEYRMYITPISG